MIKAEDKQVFISSVQSVLDMLYSSTDLADEKIRRKKPIDFIKYEQERKNIAQLERVLMNCKKDKMTENDERLALAALGTTVLYFQYLIKSYETAINTATEILKKYTE